MLHRIVVGFVLLAFCVGIALAEEIRGSITKVEAGKVTFVEVTFNKETKKIEKGAEQTLPVADNVKVVKGTFNKETKKLEAGDPVEGGLKNELFTKGGEKGVPATIVTDADGKKITQIIVGGGRK